jgi:hypothetical protein
MQIISIEVYLKTKSEISPQSLLAKITKTHIEGQVVEGLQAVEHLFQLTLHLKKSIFVQISAKTQLVKIGQKFQNFFGILTFLQLTHQNCHSSRDHPRQKSSLKKTKRLLLI